MTIANLLKIAEACGFECRPFYASLYVQIKDERGYWVVWSPNTVERDAVQAAERFGLFDGWHVIRCCAGVWSVNRVLKEIAPMQAIAGSGDTFCEAICQAILNLSEQP